MSCLACMEGLPKVRPGRLMDAGVHGLPVGWKLCVGTSMLHAPSNAAINELLGSPQEGPRPPSPSAKNAPLEETIRAITKSRLERLGFKTYDFEQGYRRTKCPECEEPLSHSTRVPLGVGDIYVIGFGVAFWIETKRPGKKRTYHQEDFARDHREHGGACYLIYSADQAEILGSFIRREQRLPSEVNFYAALEKIH